MVERDEQSLLSRCEARDGRETAAQIEADALMQLDLQALEIAKRTFRAFHASWEGSIAVAIRAYLDVASPTPERGDG